MTILDDLLRRRRAGSLIIEPELWQAVQDRLAAGRRERSMAVGAEAPSLLAGLIFDSDGARLSPTHAVKKGKRYRYYVSTALIARGCSDYPKGRRIQDAPSLSRGYEHVARGSRGRLKIFGTQNSRVHLSTM